MTAPTTFRSTPARVGAWVWLVCAALNLLDIALRGRELASLAAAAALVLGCGVAYVVGLRPAIVANETGVTVRNLLRDARIPWRAVRKIEGTTAVAIRFAEAGGTERTTRAWVLQTSPRAHAKNVRALQRDASRLPAGAAEQLKSRTPTRYVAQQLNEMAERSRKGEADAVGAVTWSWPAVVSVAVPGTVFLVLLVVGLLR
jgi:hypothetical protein